MGYDIPRAILGRTGLEVTRFGVGGAYCESAEGYRAALDCGVTYVDTARAYRDGEDEKVIGQAIKGRRDDLILATKTGQRDAEGARRDLETSLRLLNTDHIDIYQIHHLNTEEERDRAFGPGGAMEAVQKARDEGLVRFIGVTGHDWVQVQQAVADAADIPRAAVLDRRAAREPYRVAAFLLRRACNIPLRQVADMAGVSPARISQIQRAIEDSGGLGSAFPWASALERLYKI